MYRYIISDFCLGLADSIRIPTFVPILYHKEFQGITLKICKHNFIMYILPLLTCHFIWWMFGISLHEIFKLANYAVNTFSILFHSVHYFQLTKVLCSLKKSSNQSYILDKTSLTVTMAIYTVAIYATSVFIDIIINEKYWLLGFFIKFFILTIYHSFYCFNNLWEYNNIAMGYRIDMQERLWPYYIGYGTFSTIIYFFTDNPMILFFYNIYMILVISLPFMIKKKYPNLNNPSYPSISLTVFSSLIGVVFRISKSLLNF